MRRSRAGNGRDPVGSWVYAESQASPSTPGAFASRVLIPDSDLLPLPEGEPALATAVGKSGTASFIPVIQTAALRAGEAVLVWSDRQMSIPRSSLRR